MTPTFSIIIPTAGRESLLRTLASVTGQLEPGDELLVVRNDSEYGNYGRDSAMKRAAGTHLLFMDDDDAYTEGALAAIRRAVEGQPDRVHVFRMRFPDGLVLWSDPVFRMCNVGTPMVAVPNVRRKLGSWVNGQGPVSDFGFMQRTMELRGDEPVFHEDVVALVRPA